MCRSTGGVVDARLRHVVAQSEGGRQPWRQVEVCLVEQAVVGLRRTEEAGYGLRLHRDVATAGTCYHGGSSLLPHAGSHRVEHAVVGVVLDCLRQELVHGRVEVHGGVGLLPLVREEHACRALPDAHLVALVHQFVGDGVLQLCLLHVHVVLRAVVDVHQHVVLQVLPAQRIVHVSPVACVPQVQPRVQQVALVVALTVGRGVAGFLGVHVEQSVGKAVLPHVLVVGQQVQRQPLGGAHHQPQPSASLVALVGTVAGGAIAEETVLTVVESCHRECQPVAELTVVGHLGAPQEVGADAQPQVGALIVHGVLRVQPHQSALGIHTVERTLGATEHVDTAGLVEVGVEGRLRHQGNVVDIDAHRRAVDARADASDVDGRRIARPVVGHDERRDKSRHVAQVVQPHERQLAAGHHVRAQRLLAQLLVVLRRRHHDDLVQVDHP